MYADVGFVLYKLTQAEEDNLQTKRYGHNFDKYSGISDFS